MTHSLYKAVCAFCIVATIISGCASGSAARKQELQSRQETMHEIRYGRLLAVKILQRFPLLQDKKITYYVNQVGKSVALFAGRSDIVYHFGVLDTDTINAFAAPGGYIFITKGALKLMQNEAELAAVLGHEIGHVNHKHIMKELPPPRDTSSFADRLAALLVARGTAVSTAFSKVVGQAANLLFKKGYKIKEEYQSDRSAVSYIYETGYYPAALLDFLRRMDAYQQANQQAVVYHTHPPTGDRIKRLEELIKKDKLDLNRPKGEERFAKFRDELVREERERRERLLRELTYGRVIAKTIVERYPLETISSNEKVYLNRVGKSVALFAGRADMEYHFGVIKSSYVLAFAAPGGYVFLSRGALDLMQNEAELAGLLAQQIAHINLGHLAKLLPPPTEKGVKPNKVTPKLKAAAQKAARQVLDKGYTAAQCFDADRSAAYYLAETGYYPNGLADYLERLYRIKQKRSDFKAFPTYPELKERYEKLRKTASIDKLDLSKPKGAARFRAVFLQNKAPDKKGTP